MNEVYKKAIEEQGERGKPIFLANFTISKSQTFGASKKVKKEFTKVKRVVCAGNLAQIKTDKLVLFNCLVLLLGDKKKAVKADFSKYAIEEIEIISFHGYSAAK